MPQSEDQRTRILDSAMPLIARRGWRGVSLSEIATAAGISLAELRREFPSKQSMLAAVLSRADDEVLSGSDSSLEGEPRRDRLFDAIMRRFDALTPYKPAIRAMLREAPGDPLASLCRLPRLLNSMGWMLESAGISTVGLMGVVRVKALTALYLATLRTWLRDESPDLGPTMAALDRNLTRADRLLRI